MFLIVSERYDVFIAYAKPDKQFADEIVKKLESPPYCMKVCIDYRDLLAGGNHLDNVAKAIQTRCGKVVLILSENFNRCQDADFITNFVLSLSPGLFSSESFSIGGAIVKLVIFPGPQIGFLTFLEQPHKNESFL